MATIAEQLTSLANTKTAIKQAIVDKGVAVSDDTPFSGYAAKIGEISGGGGAPATKFGLSIDNILGNVDTDGVYSAPVASSDTIVLDLSSIKTVGYKGFRWAFVSLIGNYFLNLSNLEVVGDSGLERCASSGGTNYVPVKVVGVNLKSLKRVESSGMSVAFYTQDISGMLDLNALEYIGANGMQNCFYACENITGILMDCLRQVDYSGLYGAFIRCAKIPSAYFPSLTIVVVGSFGSTSAASRIFYNCTGMTEMHFRADMQATIEAMTGYSAKFGATNATIYFDLIGTITVNGVAYARDEKQSIRVDGVKTFVGWKDANDNVVYTSYANNAEPAVGTAVYSDAGTTQVGTVEGVA